MATVQLYDNVVESKKRRAFAAFPQAHKITPVDGEVVASREEGILRLQNWSCIQGFAAVIAHEEKKARQRVDIQCSRHKKKTRDTRKNGETRQRPLHNVNWLDCKWKMQIIFYKKKDQWSIHIAHDKHNHELLDNPFELTEHKCRDPDREDVRAEGQDLRDSGLAFKKARRVMRTKGLVLSPKEYYNLAQKGRKREPQEELVYALRTLENKGFSVRVSEQYQLSDNIRQSQRVRFFFFTSPRQILIARKFASNFIIITDATFNTNQNRLPLSVIVCVTNTLKTIPIAYCWIESESADAFIFMNDCQRDLFFYDDCRGPKVVLGDFAAGLKAAMVRKRDGRDLILSTDEQGEVAHAGMQVAWQLASQLDEEDSPCFLQLCNWHAAEAMKKRLTKEGYPLEQRKVLVNLIWAWILSPTIEVATRNREVLLDNLHQKDQNYVRDFYERQEQQFVYAFTRHRANLGCSSSQRGEMIHPVVKECVSRHTPIGTSTDKIAEEANEVINTYEQQLERQKRNVPRAIDASREFFTSLIGRITHEAIVLVYKQLVLAKKWLQEVERKVSYPPTGNSCEKGCDLPNQYSLPCKCWLYRCVFSGERIPISLIHPRWLYKAPEVVSAWEISFDDSVTVDDYLTRYGTGGVTGSSYGYIARDDDTQVVAECSTQPTSTRFANRGLDLVEASHFEAFEFHKKITEAHRAEEYARLTEKTLKNMNRKWANKYDKEKALPTSFAVASKDESHLKYQKGKGKRARALTGREAADIEEQEARRRQLGQLREQERTEKFADQREKERSGPQAGTGPEFREPISDFSQLNFGGSNGGLLLDEELARWRQELDSDCEAHISEGDSDNELEYIGTQPLQGRSQPPPGSPIGAINPIVSEPEPENFSHIDDFDDFPPLPMSPPRIAPAPPLTWPDRRSQQQELIAHPSQLDPEPTGRSTRAKKSGVVKKSRKVESQDKRDVLAAQEKADKATNRKAAKERKEAKKMLPREEDVSQLADMVSLLGSSP